VIWVVRILAGLIAVLVVAVAAAQVVRYLDARHAERAWQLVVDLAAPQPEAFDPASIDDLPEPARRYLLFAIEAGTSLRTVVELEMQGRFGPGDREDPGYMPMTARQILAPPEAFVWIPRIGTRFSRITGSDGLIGDEAWTRFWLLRTVPIARSASSPDLVRAAIGRAVAESLWAPATLLPQNGAVWEAVDDDRARVTIEVRGEAATLELEIAPHGEPLSFVMQRWSDANPDGVFRRQPFGGTIEAVATWEGFTIPAHIRVGNHWGTEAWFPFFDAQVTLARYR
jgi:hypothetical protein